MRTVLLAILGLILGFIVGVVLISVFSYAFGHRPLLGLIPYITTIGGGIILPLLNKKIEEG